MKRSDLSTKRIFLVGGTFISFCIGAAFATGQETLQFYAAFGLKGLLGILFFMLFNIYVNVNFVEAGRIGQFEKDAHVFRYFSGRFFGVYFDFFATVFCFSAFILMLAGAGATIRQQYGLSEALGATVVGLLACLTVLLGLKKMVDVLGSIGPLIAVMAIGASFLGLKYGKTGIPEGHRIVGEIGVMAAGKNWLFAAATYCGFNMLMLAGFFSAIGRTEKNKWDARIGTAVGVIGFSLAVSCVTLALLANIELVGLSQVPVLLMLDDINHTFASLYSIVIFLGIFSTATPLLWTLSNRIAPEHSKTYNTAAVLLTAAGIFTALKIPFNRLVNLVLTINGYAGFLLFGFILWSNVRYFSRKKG